MTLDQEQQAAVISPAATLLVAANAGSGKTRTLVERINWFLERVPAASIIAVTFTNAAGDEIEKRLGDVKLGYCGTIHGLMLRVIQKYGFLIGFKQHGVAVMDESQSEAMKQTIINDLRLKTTLPKLERELKLAWNTIRSVAAGRHYSTALLGGVEYYQRMRTFNLLDFDSILRFGLWAMEAAIQQKRWAEPYEVLLVDEFQDANVVDAFIYEMLPVKLRTYVGDDAQSIYGFRGADVGVMLTLAKSPDVTVLSLLNNYRSDIGICAVANRLICHNKNRIDKVLVPVSQEQGEVQFCPSMDSPADEASYIAHDLKECQRVHDHSDCAVLLRTNKLVQFFSEELERRGLKVRRKEWSAKPPDWAKCRMFLNLLVNPENDMLAHWWLKQSRGDLEANRIKLEALHDLKSINKYCLKIPCDIPIGMIPELLARAGIQPESLARVEKAISLLHKDDGLPELSLKLGSDELHREETKEEGVTVTTAHSAKGREWPVVYVPCLNEGIWPPGKSDDIEEERRLLYVAVTRAERKLVLSNSATSFDWNMKLKPAKVSMFWRELQ